ncbi:MAG: hypothetical protein ACYS8W_06755, partial [Planctomycetota bacterium]
EKYRRKRYDGLQAENPFAVTKEIRQAFRKGVLEYSLGDDSPEYSAEVREIIFQGELENVAEHELGHVLDFKRLIPAWRHPLRGFWIVVSNGFSPLKIGTRFETVAELNAMANSKYPHVGLYELLGWLDTERNRPYYIRLLTPDRTPVEHSPYHRMARNICEIMMDYLEDHPEAAPGFGGRKPRLGDVPKMKPEAIHEAARRKLSGHGIKYQAK